TDFPRIRAIALENHPSPSNPLGVKGAGEGPIIPVGGLMANAIGNALASFGAMPNQLPLSPARVWRMGAEAPVENLDKNARAEPVSDAAGPGRTQIRRSPHRSCAAPRPAADADARACSRSSGMD